MLRLPLLALSVLLLSIAAATADRGDDALAGRIDRVLSTSPIIDGHNDLPWEIHKGYDDWRKPLDLKAETSRLPHPLQTDLPRMKKGRVGAQFWSVWIPASLKGPEAVQTTLEQIDMVHRMVARYPTQLEMASTAADIRRIERKGMIASLIGIEGGHQIGNSPAALRMFYQLGARYMTLSHFLNNDFTDSATDDPIHHGLTPFGKAIVHEMNRIGMMVDLAHVSADVMHQAIAITRAPVIFSHSSARAIVDHPRDVPDDVLRMLPANGGIVMVNFYPGYISQAAAVRAADRAAEEARVKTLYTGQPERRKAALDAWDAAHPRPAVTVSDVADHIDHIRKIAGVDHVGIGSDFDGIEGQHPEGMDGVDKYPVLFRELARRGWSDVDLAKLSGGNMLRVMERVEQVAASMRGEAPVIATIGELDGPHR
jgi:membrane dipeptidase